MGHTAQQLTQSLIAGNSQTGNKTAGVQELQEFRSYRTGHTAQQLTQSLIAGNSQTGNKTAGVQELQELQNGAHRAAVNAKPS
jgi:hypothetical protein